MGAWSLAIAGEAIQVNGSLSLDSLVLVAVCLEARVYKLLEMASLLFSQHGKRKKHEQGRGRRAIWTWFGPRAGVVMDLLPRTPALSSPWCFLGQF